MHACGVSMRDNLPKVAQSLSHEHLTFQEVLYRLSDGYTRVIGKLTRPKKGLCYLLINHGTIRSAA